VINVHHLILKETTAEYCFTHKLENMVNVKSKDAFMKIAINDFNFFW
jgi:hypothetical protein